ncbi:Sirohydrochlorin cobaltochelatase [Polystyrenella longa]|uniref:Sirohydrochlorin cobaltochelatase n=1 Tax=Polystyrenella longa TaxID=2528007 RepID=A0A518CSP5_9PLAN|nr:CbiX/SirB N-terminal domain-containing protein [Polystyrenella longa]QDU82252.1 Sirohydrochlorin cobaltochelatase [Polystyrenella longa]
MPDPFTNPTAVLLIAHGSRRQEANDDLVTLAGQFRDQKTYPIVEHAFLELANPSIPEGAAACVEQGAVNVLMMPWFLSAGRHVADDLSDFCQQFSQKYPQTSFTVCPPLGLHPAMLTIINDRIQEAGK